jgi:hypothetical protein
MLPNDVETCPGCGQAQTLAAADNERARCAEHPELAASGTCARCGRFMCVACTDADSTPPACHTCAKPRAAELEARLRRLNVRIGAAAMTQAVLVPALAFATHDEKLTVLCLVAAVPAFVLGAVMATNGTLWIVAPIAIAVLALISLWGLGAGGFMALGVPLALVMAKWINDAGAVEKALWRLRRG